MKRRSPREFERVDDLSESEFAFWVERLSERLEPSPGRVGPGGRGGLFVGCGKHTMALLNPTKERWNVDRAESRRRHPVLRWGCQHRPCPGIVGRPPQARAPRAGRRPGPRRDRGLPGRGRMGGTRQGHAPRPDDAPERQSPVPLRCRHDRRDDARKEDRLAIHLATEARRQRVGGGPRLPAARERPDHDRRDRQPPDHRGRPRGLDRA